MDTFDKKIYIGPSYMDLGLSRFTVFDGDLPPHVASLVAKSPALKTLIVPVSDLQTARNELAHKGSRYYIALTKLTKELNK